MEFARPGRIAKPPQPPRAARSAGNPSPQARGAPAGDATGARIGLSRGGGRQRSEVILLLEPTSKRAPQALRQALTCNASNPAPYGLSNACNANAAPPTAVANTPYLASRTVGGGSPAACA